VSRATTVSESPRWARADHATHYADACSLDPEHKPQWYFGRGIGPVQHPLADRLPFEQLECGNCRAHYPWYDVVAAYCVESTTNGSQEWAAELKCVLCGSYTQATGHS